MPRAAAVIVALAWLAAVAAAEDPAAPVVAFRDLAYATAGPGEDGIIWMLADGSDANPGSLGQIEEKPLAGAQQIVWRHVHCDIDKVERRDDGDWVVTFKAGRLVLRQYGQNRWQGTFVPVNSLQIIRFRTNQPW
jgi:hypothetical protein